MTENQRPGRAPILLAFASVYLVWGSTYLAIYYAIQTLPPFLMAGTRFLVAGGAMYLWARLRGGERPTAGHWRGAAIVGAFLLLGGNGGVVWAELRVPSGLAALLVATVPLWMVMVEWGGGGLRPTPRIVAGLAVGFLGLGLLIGPVDLLGGGAVDLLGAGVLVVASLSWAIGSVVSRKLVLPSSPILGTGMQMLAGGALLSLLGLVTGEAGSLDPAGFSGRSIAALLYLIVFGSFVGFTSYVWLLRHVEVAKVATYAYVNPLVAVFLGWLLASEPLTPRTLVAAGVIVAGVVFITTGRRAGMQRPETAGVDERKVGEAA